MANGGLRIVKPLSERLNQHQQGKREERMSSKNTFRQQTEKTQAQIIGGVNTAFNGIGHLAVRQKRLFWFVGGLTAAQVITWVWLFVS